MARYDKIRKDLTRRLDKLSGKLLKEISEKTSIFSYQYGYTKHGLQRIIKTTKNRDILNAMADVVELYERYGTQTGITQVVDDIYKTGDETIKTFIRIQRDKGWDESQILIALENSYDVILYMASDEMMKAEYEELEVRFHEDFYDLVRETGGLFKARGKQYNV